MPIDYARRLTGRHRSTDTHRHLGFTLAFVAGATNAGAYLAVKQYTSHMTGHRVLDGRLPWCRARSSWPLAPSGSSTWARR